MSIEYEPSCTDPSDPELLPVAIAVKRVAEQLIPITQTQRVPLREALDRVLAEDVTSPVDVPGYTNSAMDGYAIRSADIPEHGEASLKVIGTAWAGVPLTEKVDAGQAARIMTGAMMPDGLDTVVIQEHVRSQDNQVTIDSHVEPGRNVRQAGEDVQAHQMVLLKGIILDPAHIGLLASLGIDTVKVVRKLRVAFFTTGDELRSLETHAGAQLGPGELFDSNRYTLFGMLSRLHADVIDLGVVKDSAEDTRDAFLRAAASADVILSSGGVSAGDADFVTKVFHEIGQVSFWKLAMRPGRPLAFGKIDQAFFFGLPGNPVAVMVAFYEFVQPALKKMMGCSQTTSPIFPAICTSRLRKSPGRTEYQRGILGRDEAGRLTVKSTGKQGAGRLSSMAAADCLIVLAPGSDTVQPGDLVEVQPFFGLT